MPTYQYACKECDHRFEAVQSFSDASLTECPVCAGPLRKLFGSVGVIFKGSGFYRNDARSDPKPASPAAANAKDSAPSSETKSSTDAKKPETTKSDSGSTSSTSSTSSSSSSKGTTKTATAAS